MNVTLSFIKVAPLIQFANKKENKFSKMILILELENWHQNLKKLFIDSPQSKVLKISKKCSFGCKNLLSFTFLTMKFHNCHHASGIIQRVHFPVFLRIHSSSNEVLFYIKKWKTISCQVVIRCNYIKVVFWDFLWL